MAKDQPTDGMTRAKRNRGRERLSAIEVMNFVKRPRAERSLLLHDGAGLYLIRHKRGGLSWVFKYRHEGAARTLGLGPWPECDLAKARTRHGAARTLLKVDRVDPIEHKRQELAAKRLAMAKAMTFEEAA
ncbi:MAG TPA: Arm DNA-binding domain-containing protein, partial [Caulobacteraceae bacterium]|nr:Arm DNA-binding domain-containing protein [Caulobacteraceae bacterium]